MGPPDREYEYFLFLTFIIAFLSIHEAQAQCTSEQIPTSLATISQYKIGEEGDSYYSHFLLNGDSQYDLGVTTASPIYQLAANAILAPTTDCSTACLTNVSAYYRANNDTNTLNVTFLMLRPSDQPLYPEFIDTEMSFLCATTSGYCGAKTPLYQYYSSQLDDYIADLQKPSNTSASYTISNMGLPLCYLWTPNVTTTTSTTSTTTATTTTAINSSATVAPVIVDSNDTSSENETTTITTTTIASDLNSTTTTVNNLNSTSTTTSDPNGNMTTTTSANSGSNLTTTTTINPSNTNTTVAPGSNSTSTAQSSDKKKGFWHNWKWPIIVVGCLLAIGTVVGCVGWLTCCFIGAGATSAIAPKMASPPPSYSSPSPPELPPQPIDAPSVPPFTVGLPPTVPY